MKNMGWLQDLGPPKGGEDTPAIFYAERLGCSDSAVFKINKIY